MTAALRRRLPPARDLAPLGVLLALGAALRVFLSLVYYPAALNQYDANSYVWQAEGELFESVFQAPGYSLFLRGAHLFSDDVVFTVSVQHLLPLLTATLAWHALYRLTRSRWWGLVPAAIVLFEADALLVEHALMSETLFTLLVVAAVWAALGALRRGSPVPWLAAAGTLLGMAIWVRYPAIALVPVLLGWSVFALRPRWRAGLVGAAAASAPIAALIAIHVLAQGAQNGYYGLGESGGWALYSRVASFADCREFDPPEGSEDLCVAVPPEERINPDTGVRYHPDWYGYNTASPAKRLFGGQPAGNEVLGSWARAAILAQPLDYAETVASDLLLYFDPAGWTNFSGSLIGPKSVSFRLRVPDEHCYDCSTPDLLIEANSEYGFTDPAEGSYYQDFERETREGIEFFQSYQRVARMHGWLLAVLAVLSLLGLFAARGRAARAQWLMTLAAVALILFPVATTTYNIRYALPAIPLFAMAATLAAWSLRDVGRQALPSAGGPHRR
jgi:hypothetical protein